MQRSTQPPRSIPHPTRRALLSAAGFYALASLPACGPRKRLRESSTPDTLTVALPGACKSLDPYTVTDAASMRYLELQHRTLLRYGQAFDQEPIVGDLATKWHINQTGDQITFTLTPDAHFHDGTPLRAPDAQAALRHLAEHGVRRNHLNAVDRIDTPDDRTLILHLKHPDAALLTNLAHPMNAITRGPHPRKGPRNGPRKGSRKGAEQAPFPGAGPYQLADWTRGASMSLKRVGAAGGFPRIQLRAITDPTARLTAVRTGEVDLLHGLTPNGVQVLNRSNTDPAPTIHTTPGTFFEYIGLNCRTGPLADARVRRAIAWAIDRDRLNQAIKFGQATPLPGGHLPPNHWAHLDEAIYPYQDHAQAQALLRDAGLTQRLPLTLKVDATQNGQVRAAEMVKQQLKPVGIDLTLKAVEPAIFYGQLNRGDFQLTLVGWLGFVDPDEWVSDLFHTQGRFNQQGYANPAVDRLIQQGVTTPDRARRRTIYQAIQAQIARDAPMVFLYINPETVAAGPRAAGFKPHPTATLRGLEQLAAHP